MAYANPYWGYQFKYPRDSKVSELQQNSVHFDLPFTPGTNLVSKWLDVSAMEVDDSAKCASNNPGQSQSQQVTINGIVYLKQSGLDQGAGQRYNWTSYASTRQATCVIFNFVLKSGNPDMYATPVPPLFNETAETAILAEMIATFGWLEPYAVYNIKSNDSLNVRSGAGVGYAVVTTLPFDKKNVFRSGPKATANSAEWWQIYKPDGSKGWVNAAYLTEYRKPVTVCTDMRIGTLLQNFDAAVTAANGTSLAGLVSPKHGLDVRYSPGNQPVNLSKGALAGIFTSKNSYNWGASPGSGLDVVGTFKDKIQPKLLDVLNVNYDAKCNDTSHTGAINNAWPAEYTNLSFYALYKPGTPGIDLDWRTWILGIEYVDGKPGIAVLIHYEWAP